MAETSRAISGRLWAICGLLTIVIFVVDQSVLLGVAGGVPYIAVIVLTARIPGRRSTVLFGIACSVLTMAGFVLSPADGPLWQAVLNRALGLAVIWITVAFVDSNKKINKALARSQASARMKFPFRIDVAAEAIVSVDRNGCIILFNLAAEKMFGHTAAEVLAQPIDVLLPPDIRDVHSAFIGNFAEESNVSRLVSGHGEIRAIRKGGSEFPVKASISKADLGGEIVFTAILRDITDYKSTEAALDWERTLLRTLMEAWPDLVFVKDRESRFLVANAKTAAVMGAGSPEELIGRTDFDYYPSEVAADFLASERKLMESGQTVMGREEIVAGPDGRPVWLSTTKVPLIRGGQIVGLVGINRDITLRKQEDRALNAAKEQAELASRAKSEFLANMSHELRTPLNAIIGFSEIIAQQTIGPLGNDRYCNYGRDIRDAGRHLLDLINNILDLSKVESGVDELHEEVVVVEEIADSVIRLLKIRARQADVALVKEVPGETPALYADARKLKQILSNLLSNAIKFTGAGGHVTLRVSCALDRGYVFQISDTGIGIAPEDFAKAWSLFGQVDGQLNRRQEGTGLGLPLTKALVELHGGSLELESEVGSGTTITVRFPASRTIAGDSHAQVI